MSAIVPLGFGGAHAQGPIASVGVVAWSEEGQAYVRRRGKTAQVGPGEAIGVDGPNVVVFRNGRLIDGARSVLVIATDARWGSGHLLVVHPDLDGRISVVIDGRTVEHVQADNPHVYPGQINARYAVWTAGGGGYYWVERYDLRTHRRLRVPGGDYVHPQYGAAVDSRGAVYYAASGHGCGGATLYRWRGGTRTRLAGLPRSQDYASAWVADGRLYLDLGQCGAGTQRLVTLRV